MNAHFYGHPVTTRSIPYGSAQVTEISDRYYYVPGSCDGMLERARAQAARTAGAIVFSDAVGNHYVMRPWASIVRSGLV